MQVVEIVGILKEIDVSYLNCCIGDEKIVNKVGVAIADSGPKNTILYRIGIMFSYESNPTTFCGSLLLWASPGFTTICPREMIKTVDRTTSKKTKCIPFFLTLKTYFYYITWKNAGLSMPNFILTF